MIEYIIKVIRTYLSRAFMGKNIIRMLNHSFLIL